MCRTACFVTSALLSAPSILTATACLLESHTVTAEVAPRVVHMPAPLEPFARMSSEPHISKNPVMWPGQNAFAFI